MKGWVVDTCVLLDVLDDDPRYGRMSAETLQGRMAEGLIVCPVSIVEMAPAFMGEIARTTDFLARMGATFTEPWTWQDTLVAHRAWASHVAGRRGAGGFRRPVADVLIGAFASRFHGLVTRNERDFRRLFPSMKMIVPG